MNDASPTEFSLEKLDFNFDNFLSVYKDSAKVYSLKDFKKYSGDVALYYLLLANRDSIERAIEFDVNDITYIHTCFRKFDVTGNAQTDNAIWTLMSASELFWDVLRSLAEGKNYSEEF